MRKPVRVVIADDHQVVREGLQMILAESDGEIIVVGEASDGDEAEGSAVVGPASWPRGSHDRYSIHAEIEFGRNQTDDGPAGQLRCEGSRNNAHDCSFG